MDYKVELAIAYNALQDIMTLERTRILPEEEDAFKNVINVIGRAMLRHIRLNTMYCNKDDEGFLSEQKIVRLNTYFAKAKEAMDTEVAES